MAYFELRVQKIRKFFVRLIFVLAPLILFLCYLKFYDNKVSESAIRGRNNSEKISRHKLAKENLQIQPSTTTLKSEEKIDELAKSRELRDIVQIEKVWNDGTLSFKVGEDIVTVTSDGAVLYLPKEL